MKKTLTGIAACLSFIFLVGILGCGVGAAGKKKTDTITLKMWESDGVEKDFMLFAAKEFKKTHPHIEFVYEPIPVPDARSQLEMQGPAGNGPDIFAAAHDHIGALVEGGHILPFKELTVLHNCIGSAVISSEYQGKTYGYPLAIETYALFYNKDILPEPPKTWAEVEAFARSWNSKEKNRYALVWETANAYFNYIFIGGFDSPLFGPNGNDRSQHNINSKNAITGLTYFQSLRKKIFDVPSADITGDFCNALFEEGKAPMIITGPWKIADFSKAGVNFGIAAIPVFPGMYNPPSSFSGLRVAFVSAYTKYPKEAKAFARFISSREMLEKRFEITKQIPPRNDISVTDPLSKGILQQVRYAFPMPAIPEMGTYWTAMESAFSDIWDGADVEGQLNNAAAVMNAAR